MVATCLLCTDIQLHNRFCQEHKTRTPRSPAVAKLLGVTVEEVIRHRRHQDCYVVKYPVSGARVVDAEKEQTGEPTQHDPLTDLQNLRKILQHFLAKTFHNTDVSAGDIVRITAELRSLIVATEDLQVKLLAAAGNRNSAFTQAELGELAAALQDICPACKERVCGKLSLST